MSAMNLGSVIGGKENLTVDSDVMLDGCLIVGAEGSGKTSFVRRLIDEHLRLDVPVVAFDTTGDLTARFQRDLELGVSRDLDAVASEIRIRLRSVDLDDVLELFELPQIASSGRLVSAVLSLMQYRPRPATPEHALLETLVVESWETGAGLSIEELAAKVTDPAIRTLGGFDLDTVISPERRNSLSSSLLAIRDTALAWGGRTAQAPSLDDLLTHSDGAVVTVLSFGQQSLRVRRFIVEVLLSMIEFSDSELLLVLDEAAAFLPPLEMTATASLLLEALGGGTDFSGVRVALVATEPDDLHQSVADLCQTWVVGRMPAPRGRRQVVEALDLVNPPVDEKKLDSDLMHLAPGHHVLRSARLDALVKFAPRHAESQTE